VLSCIVLFQKYNEQKELQFWLKTTKMYEMTEAKFAEILVANFYWLNNLFFILTKVFENIAIVLCTLKKLGELNSSAFLLCNPHHFELKTFLHTANISTADI
jgi:hypothetical protein